MKKSLILGVAMALGITASAYAANPFSDVPKDSWAYDAVNKLAAAGIINGFPNGTFGGEKLMTRYEMAQIVAKAMAKGANVDRLAAEFAEELDALGVRVAALEKKQDNVTITGAFRARYINQRPQANQGQGYIEDLRTRLWVNGAINDDWQYVGMLQNVHDMSDAYGDSQDGVNLYRVFVTGRIGAVNVTAGRYEQFVAQGNILDAQSDGVQLSYGTEKFNITGFYGRANESNGWIYNDQYVTGPNANRYYGVELNTYWGSEQDINVGIGYSHFKDVMGAKGEAYYDVSGDAVTGRANKNDNIWYAWLGYNIGENWDFSLMYLNSNWESQNRRNSGDSGWAAGITYKGVVAAQPGSWGAFANWYNQPEGTYIDQTTDANVFWNAGFKGWNLGAQYAFAKGIVGTVAYYGTQSKGWTPAGNDVKDHMWWTDVTFTF